jgi:predicted permease
LRSGVDAGTRRKTSFLVAAEIAVAVVLVTVVGVLGRSLLQLYAVDPGFEPAGVLTATVELPNDRYDAAARDNTFSELIERSRGLPGVTSAGMISALPLHGQTWTFDVTVEGAGEAGYISEARHMTIDSGYFETARVPLLAGRWFTEADGTAKGETRDDPGVVIVNRLAVERHFGGRDPIGQTIHTGAPDSPGKHAIVIGVVENEAQDALSAPLLPQIYEPYKADARTQMTVVMRTDGEPSSLAGPFRGVLRDIDSTLPILDLQTQLEVVDSSLLLERFLVSTTGALASLALLFAALGVYATLAFWVSRRRHEIGVRQALGASSGDLLGLVLARGLKPVVVGAGVGLGASLLLGFVTRRFVGELLYQTTPWDPATLVSALAVLALVSLVACLGPALRAARSDPNETLRAQ